MSNDPEVSKDGVYIDTQANKVVKTPPEEGVQLAAPGVEIDSIAKQYIEAAERAVSGGDEVAAVDDDVETADEKSKTVTTPKRKS